MMTKPESVGISGERLGRITTFIQDYLDRGLVAGAVTLVARHGELVHLEAQGYRWREARAPMEPDTIFSLVSMTKPIVSTALMMLWEEGRCRLDDPIAQWLPRFAGQQVLEYGQLRPAEPVTIRHVLTHTSGMALANATEAPGGSDASPAATLREAVDRLASLPLTCQPGTRWQYGVSTDVVAALVEGISGYSIDQFTRERILTPLGMADTGYHVAREHVARLAAVYRPQEGGGLTLLRAPAYQAPTRYFPGVGGMSGTAIDYLRFCQMLLNGGELDGQRLLGPLTVNQMFTNQIGSDKLVYVRGPGWGFGLGAGVLIDSTKAQDALSPGTWSWGGSEGTLFYIDPVEDLIALLMVQLTPYQPSQIRPRFSNVVAQAITKSCRDKAPRVRGY